MASCRPYAPSDRDAVVSLWYRSWHAAFPDLQHPQPLLVWKERFEREIEPSAEVWVTEQDGDVAGFMALLVGQGVLDQLFIAPEWSRSGAGSALVVIAKARCPAGLTLSTLERNAMARAFYERHGFRSGERGVNRVNGQPTITYRWTPSTTAG